MIKLKHLVLSLFLTTVFIIPVSAEMDGMKGHKHGGGMEQHGGKMEHGRYNNRSGHHRGHKKGHIFGKHWKETLTEEQKTKADKMHLELKKELSIIEAKMKVKKVELSNIILQDNIDQKAMDKKIDEILELKREIMHKKYGHKVQMRALLTADQRVSFDMGIMEKAAYKMGHKAY